MAGARSIGILVDLPAHRGHLAWPGMRRPSWLEWVLLIPAHSAPHKGEEGDPDGRRRLEMCRLAVGGEAGAEACALEIERGGPSYTVDTLRAIKQSDPKADLTFIVGAEHPGCTLPVCASRCWSSWPGWRSPSARTPAARRSTGRWPHWVRVVPATPTVPGLLFAGAQRVKAGEPIGLVAPAVAEYIAAHALYRGASADTKANMQGQQTRAKAGAK